MTDSVQEQLNTPIYDVVPEQWENAREYIVERFTTHAMSINAKEIGWYLDVELDTGKKFIPKNFDPAVQASTSEIYRTILRKVVVFGALPNTTSKPIAHGITVDDKFTLIQMYAAATDPTDPGTFPSLPIPHASPTLVNNIELKLDDTNVIITTGSDRTAFTRCNVVIEYIQEIDNA